MNCNELKPLIHVKCFCRWLCILKITWYTYHMLNKCLYSKIITIVTWIGNLNDSEWMFSVTHLAIIRHKVNGEYCLNNWPHCVCIGLLDLDMKRKDGLKPFDRTMLNYLLQATAASFILSMLYSLSKLHEY